MLKKIKFYWNDDGEKVNISNLKIYWDTIKKQFRRKFCCAECEKFINCYCYDDLYSVLSDIKDGMLCDDCSIDLAFDELSIFDIVDMLDDERFIEVQIYEKTLVTKEEIKQYLEDCEIYNVKNIEDIKDLDYYEIISEYTDKINMLRDYVLNLLSYDEKREYVIDTSYEYCYGEACNL